jgi:hypothetical protein
VRKTNHTSAIFLAYEVVVKTLNVVDNVEEELPAHPKTTPKYHLAMQWVVGKVVSIENEVAFQPLPRLAPQHPHTDPPRRGFASVWAYNAMRHDNIIKCSSSSATMILASSSIRVANIVLSSSP